MHRSPLREGLQLQEQWGALYSLWPPRGAAKCPALPASNCTGHDNLRRRKRSVCCPETADLHLGKEVDQQPSATKQAYPALNLEATVLMLQLTGHQQSFADRVHRSVRPALEHTAFTYTSHYC